MTAALETLKDLRATDPRSANPWLALWAMMVGFFMILVDATIVAVANPSIMDNLQAGYDAVIWVTSAYLLAYAVPLLLAGRLGDRFGTKNLYLGGLALFTAASLWCGLAGSIDMLIAARVAQGIGAALMTPQTLSAITRLFPADRRGVALSIWGATAGVATLVGPLAGGVLVDALSWHWIFIVNVPVGVIGLALAYWFVPVLSSHRHGFDLLGVVLSGVGMFLIVFALQEGQSHGWAMWIWAMIAGGAAFMAGFVWWQSVNPGEPLIPLKIFGDNDFSLSNLGIAVIGFAVTAMILPLMFYAQSVCGLSPTRSALLISPMAIASGVLAPFVGRLVDRVPPRPIVGFGFSAVAIALTWLSVEMTTTTPVWRLVLPLILMGAGMAFVWSPLAATATRHLPTALAGAGSGVYNTTRQVGGVLGSAGIAAFMTARIGAEMPGDGSRPSTAGSVTTLPEFLAEPFSAALSQSLLLPAFVALFGVVAALFLRGAGDRPSTVAQGDDRGPDELDEFTAGLRSPARAGEFAALPAPGYGRGYAEPDYFADDDEYVEYTVQRDDFDWAPSEPAPTEFDLAAADPAAAEAAAADAAANATANEDGVTEPLGVHVQHPLQAPAHTWHGGPVESWRRASDRDEVPVATNGATHDDGESWRGTLDQLLDDGASATAPPPEPAPELIGFAHNGIHVDHDEQFRAPLSNGGGRHARRDDAHADADAGTYGRHSMRFRD